MRKSSSRLIVAVGLVGVLSLAGCSQGDDRPDPTAVVSVYLDAIASGDATTASDLDREAVSEETRGTARGDYSDLDLLRTDAVLTGSDGRITRVSVESKARPLNGQEDVRWVGFTYELDGEEYSDALDVSWDEDAHEWVLAESFTTYLNIGAEVSPILTESVPFELEGATVGPFTDPDDSPVWYLIYPGVYTVTAEFDESLLTDDSGLTRRLTATAGQEVGADFLVTALPSGKVFVPAT